VNEVNKNIEPETGAWLSIGAYIGLSIIKLIISYIAGSQALRADGLNNLSDLVVSTAILIGLKISKKPRDHNHPYGHSRAEHISSLVAAFLMMFIGMEVLIEGFHSIVHLKKEAPEWLAAWTGGFSALVMLGVYAFNRRLAKQTKSQAIEAAAKDNLSDALVSIGTVIGIVGAQFQLFWFDPLAAIIVGMMICKTAWEIFSETSHMLTDGFDEHILNEYKKEIALVQGVQKVADVKARMLGNEIILDVTIQVDPQLNVVKSHEIADRIEAVMKEQHNIQTTHVHVEPAVHVPKRG
jgi:cation diffusion facilitator family transporter